MPRVELMDPYGMCYSITTREEGTLRAWFDEVLPHVHLESAGEAYWPKVIVWPMPAWGPGAVAEMDWVADTRVLGRMMELRAKDGDGGIAELRRLHSDLEAELAGMEKT